MIAGPLASPLFEGTSGTSAEVPARFDCALDGVVWMLDEKYMGDQPQMKRSSVQLYKPQTDQSGQISERSLNPEDLARASQESWHRGAGQTFLDRPDSDPFRFRSSKGIDPWTRWELSLLPDTNLFSSSAATNLRLAPTSTRLFWIDGTAVKYDDDLSGSPSTMTGTHDYTSIATNGYDVWAADGSNLYHWVRTDTSVGAASSTDDVTLLAWVRGKARLMGAHLSEAYNITDVAAVAFTNIAPSIISTDFRWVGFAEGPSCIYGAGWQGDKSMIFRWGIKSDGTGLDVAVPALSDGLPDGEIVTAIYSYGGVVVIGTDQGFRFAIPVNDAGDLKVGPLVEIGSAVRCFEGQGRFVWFGWDDFDSASTGLGRIDPTQLTEDLVPAYASDLMATAQGNVLSVCTYAGKRVLAVSGAGIYVEDTDLTSDAYLRTGLITHSLPDPKVGMYVIVNHEELMGCVTVAVATDGDDFVDVGTSCTEGETTRVLNVGQSKGDTFEVQLAPTPSDTDATVGPSVTRLTFESNPAPGRGENFFLYLLNAATVKDRNGNSYNQDTLARYRQIVDIISDGRPVSFQDAGGGVSVFVDDFEMFQEKTTSTFYDGTIVVKARRGRRRVA